MTPRDRFNAVLQRMLTHAPISFGEPANRGEVQQAEQQLGMTFPESYRWFLEELGSCYWPDYVFGLGKSLPPGQNILYVTERERHHVEPSMPNNLLPFAPDGCGNHYCLNTSKVVDGECPVVFWDHEIEQEQLLEQTHSSFLEWLEERVNTEVKDET